MTNRTISWNAPYTFSGKEKDVETGYGYFGARYYDSGLSIWLSVDPMSDKYPSMSPYNYCMNNPIIIIDPDGKDCDIVVEGNTITISATYYTKKGNEGNLQAALDEWNSQSGKYQIKGEDGKMYDVKFNLKVSKEKFETDQSAHYECEQDSKTKTGLNFVSFESMICEGKKGSSDGKECIMYGNSGKRTWAHEIGHTLGLGEWDSGLMESGGTSETIFPEHIQGVFIAAELQNKPIKVNCNEQNSNPLDAGLGTTTYKGNPINGSLIRK